MLQAVVVDGVKEGATLPGGGSLVIDGADASLWTGPALG